MLGLFLAFSENLAKPEMEKEEEKAHGFGRMWPYSSSNGKA